MKSHLPLYVQIENDLYEQVTSGDLPPGAQIPSEKELSLKYKCARMTVRKALDGLVNRGVLIRQSGKGTFVSEGLLSYHLSTTLSFSRTLRARGYEVTTKVLRQEIVPASPTVARELKLPLNSDVVLIRRLRYVQGRPAAIHTSYLDHRTYAPMLKVELTEESLLVAIEQISGKGTISYSVDSVRPSLVSLEDSELLALPLGSPVLEVEGTSFNDHEQPIHFNRATYPGDMFRLVVVNTHSQVSSLRVDDLAIQKM